ncbi:hypothetical protein C9374_006665 [Naegleria lovaniensis]|uniref:NmrA-like domain-containing protein n=1 Tax=Naegleria lovaniensis TaxID=51637 RepID=A0AA88GJ65_NAELO|nr:uncharacterized protein C9374_006665 [Naegleria lovaniensis]KAG2379548.1 hypothetical protein C9374_006665 [Naegleria lovaniensis]
MSQPSANNNNNENTYSKVFLVGATGIVGQHVTKALLKHHPHTQVKLLIRKESEQKASELKQLGAELVFGDLTTLTTQELDHVLDGSEVIVSALSGDSTVLHEAQLKLLQSAQRVKSVKKFLPSAFGVDHDSLQYGVFISNDIKKKFAELVVNSGWEYVFVNTYMFYSYAALPNFLFEYHPETKIVKYDGERNTPIPMTDLEDVGKFTALAALRKDIKNQSVNVKGDVKTLSEIAKLLHGNDIQFEKGLDLDALKQDIERKLKSGIQQPQDFFTILVLQLRWIFATGIATPQKYDNLELFKNVQPKSFEEFVATLSKQH